MEDTIPILSWRGSPIKADNAVVCNSGSLSEEENYEGGDLEQYWSQMQTIDAGSVGMVNTEEGGLEGFSPMEEASPGQSVLERGFLGNSTKSPDYEDANFYPETEHKFVFDGMTTSMSPENQKLVQKYLNFDDIASKGSIMIGQNSLDPVLSLDGSIQESFSPTSHSDLPVNIAESPLPDVNGDELCESDDEDIEKEGDNDDYDNEFDDYLDNDQVDSVVLDQLQRERSVVNKSKLDEGSIAGDDEYFNFNETDFHTGDSEDDSEDDLMPEPDDEAKSNDENEDEEEDEFADGYVYNGGVGDFAGESDVGSLCGERNSSVRTKIPRKPSTKKSSKILRNQSNAVNRALKNLRATKDSKKGNSSKLLAASNYSQKETVLYKDDENSDETSEDDRLHPVAAQKKASKKISDAEERHRRMLQALINTTHTATLTSLVVALLFLNHSLILKLLSTRHTGHG